MQNNKRILYLTHESLINEPILKSQVVPLIIRLKQELGYKIDLFTIDNDSSDIGEDIKHIIVRRYNNKIFREFKYAIKLLKIFNKYDIIHTRSYIPTFYASVFKLFFRKSVIFDMRGVLPEETLYQGKGIKKMVLYYFYNIVETFGIKTANKIITVSEVFKTYILNKYKIKKNDKIENIRTFSIKSELKSFSLREELNIPSNFKIFVYSGSISKWQKFEEIVYLYTLLKQEISESLLLVFTNQYSKAENILVKFLKSNEFRICNFNNEALLNALTQCDMGFLLREDSIVNKVASPIKFNDYLASNLPLIISNNIGDTESIIEKYNAGIIIRDISSKEAMEQFLYKNIEFIKKLMNEKELIDFETLYAKEISIENVVIRYSQLYKQLP